MTFTTALINHFQIHTAGVKQNTFLPTWSLKIFEITTGTLCSAPPWKSTKRKMRMNGVAFQWRNLLPKLLSQTQTVNSATQRLSILTLFSPESKLICLLWCLSPDRQSPVFAVQQFCALESGSFLLAKRYCEHWNSILELCGMNDNASLEPSGALTFTWDSLPLVQTTSSFCMVNTSLVNFRQTS